MRQLKITKQVTNRETASLDKYLQEIGRVDLITADEEVELAQRIKAGDNGYANPYYKRWQSNRVLYAFRSIKLALSTKSIRCMLI